MKHNAIGYHPAVIPDDAAGRPLSPTELATIADLERRLLVDGPAPVRRKPRAWYRSANGVPLAALLGAGVLLVVVTAFAWPLLPPTLGGPVRPRRALRIARLARPH